MKFICDQMLAGLGKWLRVAGYDTLIVDESIEDKEILSCALRENRLLLTRDRHFQEMQAPPKTVIFFKSNSLIECIRELNHELKINWLYAPFSRCLICNSALIEPSKEDILEQVPADIRARSEQFWFCPQCQKVYWEGSHTQKMQKQLQDWQTI